MLDAAALLVTHQADVAEACDHTVTVAGGRIIANSPAVAH